MALDGDKQTDRTADSNPPTPFTVTLQFPLPYRHTQLQLALVWLNLYTTQRRIHRSAGGGVFV